ncbi:MAG: sigma-54 dependent transcriptional regulator [Ignavibacteria bacterium]|nr:sigma-54 dependent transcriptional regulator [Ignavibacteria bacterium]
MEKKLIFLIDDEVNFTRLMEHWIRERWGYNLKVFNSTSDFLQYEGEEPDLILLDIMLPGELDGVELLKVIKNQNPDLPVIMLSAQGNVDIAVETIKIGAFDYFSKPVELNKLEIAIKNAIKNYELQKKVKCLLEEREKIYQFDNIIAVDDKMQEVFKLMKKVINTSVNVLIYGESGTGKELIARAIHANSNRKDKPFVVVNCASIPKDLLESELFGHEKGSFTGAFQRKIGKFELADGGTIFLDEIGELELSLQAKLLRVIQDKTFERVGGNEQITTTARIISATNKDLKKAVDEKLFREDLYYRLSTFPISVPPLRERRSDIVVLADHFVRKFAAEANIQVPSITKEVIEIFLRYPWPGNVRELENVLQRAVLICDENKIQVKDLPLALQAYLPEALASMPQNVQAETHEIIPLEKIKENALRHALKVTKGNIQEAARRLKIGRATIYRMMKEYNIKIEKEE